MDQKEKSATRIRTFYTLRGAHARWEARKSEKYGKKSGGEPHADAGWVQNDLSVHAGETGGGADHQPEPEDDLHQSRGATGSKN